MNTADLPSGKKFKSRFIQPGLAGYPQQYGNVLITKESLDKFVNTLEGKPVIINHQEVTTKNVADIEVGRVHNVWFNDEDGWYWCDGVLTSQNAIDLINDGYSVSCSYNVSDFTDKGGTVNNIKYDMEFLDGVFTHLAIVNNPRYEGADITVINSGDWIESEHPRDELGRFSTKEFKNWFGNSKVVSQDGTPLQVYHGTSSDFETFEYSSDRQTGTDYGEAYYFTDDYDKASGYGYDVYKDEDIKKIEKKQNEIKKEIIDAVEKEDWNNYTKLQEEHKKLTSQKFEIMQNGTAEKTGGKVVSAYLSLQNPLIVDAKGQNYHKVYEQYFKEAKEKGNDGIIVKRVIDNPRGEERPINVYIAFKPEQIKSTKNKGKYNIEDKNIYNSTSEEITPENAKEVIERAIKPLEDAEVLETVYYSPMVSALAEVIAENCCE